MLIALSVAVTIASDTYVGKCPSRQGNKMVRVYQDRIEIRLNVGAHKTSVSRHKLEEGARAASSTVPPHPRKFNTLNTRHNKCLWNCFGISTWLLIYTLVVLNQCLSSPIPAAKNEISRGKMSNWAAGPRAQNAFATTIACVSKAGYMHKTYAIWSTSAICRR